MAEEESYVPEASFTSLILTLSSSAWLGLGKIADPVSGELKKDLKGVKLTIDMLIMLREKTRGNLSSDEEKLLNAVIGDLQANYAETVFSERESAGVSKEAETSDSSGKGDHEETSKTTAVSEEKAPESAETSHSTASEDAVKATQEEKGNKKDVKEETTDNEEE